MRKDNNLGREGKLTTGKRKGKDYHKSYCDCNVTLRVPSYFWRIINHESKKIWLFILSENAANCKEEENLIHNSTSILQDGQGK